MSTPASEIARPRVRRHSFRIYIAAALASLAFIVWGIARLAVCWGDYGWVGEIFCRSHWVMPLALLLGVAAFAMLLFELVTLARDREAVRGRFKRTRVAWAEYRRLERREFAHVTIAAVLLIALCLAYLYLVVLSRVRF